MERGQEQLRAVKLERMESSEDVRARLEAGFILSVAVLGCSIVEI